MTFSFLLTPRRGFSSSHIPEKVLEWLLEVYIFFLWGRKYNYPLLYHFLSPGGHVLI